MTTEQKAFIAMARERLERARSFAADSRHPRFEVGDAYYSMFYAAQAALLQLGLSADKHSGVVSLFAKEFCKTDILPRDLATILRKAMDARHEGDHDWQANITTDEADIHLANADAFIAAVEQYLLK